MKNTIKIVLLGVIALLAGYKTYTMVAPEDGMRLPKLYKSDNTVVKTDVNTDPVNNDNPVVNNDEVDKIVTPSAPVTTISFKETEYDFGDVTVGGSVTHNFRFTNTGENPLIIQEAKGSCGCTVPKYSKEPIIDGEDGEILVEFKPSKGALGIQNKSITVTANTDPEKHILKIRANVIEADDAEGAS